MKTLTAFKNNCAELIKYGAELELCNRELLEQVEEQRTLAKEELLKQVEENRALEKQIVTLTRQKRRAEVRHAQQLQKQRARAAELRTKMGEYRRDLVALRTIVRHQERT